ncbi:MAG: efflux RND transporter permease subunit, partial [Pseudomonadota bacterium]
RATELLEAYPGVEEVHWTIGESAPRVYYNAFNNQNGVAGYAAGHVRTISKDRTRVILPAIQQDVRAEFPEAQFLTLPFEQGPPVAAPIEFFIIGPDLNVLKAKSDEARAILGATPGVVYTKGSIETGAPKITFDADETATELAGVRLTELAADLSAELEGVSAGNILEGVEELPVRVIAPDSRRGDLGDLSGKMVGAGPGGMGAPLSALGDLTLDPEIAVITRRNGERTSTVFGYLEPYALPAPALSDFQARLDAAGFELPQGYRLEFGGEADTRGDAVGGLLSTALPLVIAMLGCVTLVFNSFRLAALVFSTGVLSIGLAFLGVWLFGLPMGLMAIIGGMGLLGIAINGAIVVLSALTANKDAVAGDVQAIEDVTVDATRHIVATTFTTIGGFAPLIATGDSFWLPLATGIAGG